MTAAVKLWGGDISEWYLQLWKTVPPDAAGKKKLQEDIVCMEGRWKESTAQQTWAMSNNWKKSKYYRVKVEVVTETAPFQ